MTLICHPAVLKKTQRMMQENEIHILNLDLDFLSTYAWFTKQEEQAD